MSSALVGHPPAGPRDEAIIRGMLRLIGLPDSQIVAGQPFPLPPQYQDGPHSSKKVNGIVEMSIMMFLVIFVTGSRIFLRFSHPELRLGLDDAFIALALLLAVAWYSIAIVVYVIAGTGNHIYDVTYQQMYWHFRLSNTCFVIFYVAVGIAATSIACFNRRITGLTSPNWKIFHTALLALIVVTTIIGLFMTIFRCSPAIAAFDIVAFGATATPPKCLSFDHVGLGLTIVQNICQFVLLGVPIIIISLVKYSLGTKIRLSMLFAIGALSVIGAVMCQLYQNKKYIDLPIQLHAVATWAAIDLGFVIFAASLPILNVVLPHHWPGSRSNSRPGASPLQSKLDMVKVRNLRKTKGGDAQEEFSELGSRPDGTIYEPDERDEEGGSRSWYKHSRSGHRGSKSGVRHSKSGSIPLSPTVQRRKEVWEDR